MGTEAPSKSVQQSIMPSLVTIGRNNFIEVTIESMSRCDQDRYYRQRDWLEQRPEVCVPACGRSRVVMLVGASEWERLCGS